MNTYLWKGYHHRDLLNLMRTAYQKNDLVIVIPPYVNDYDFFIDYLPGSEVIPMGQWSNHRPFLVTNSTIHWKDCPLFGVFTSGTTRENPRLVLYSKKNLEVTLKGIMSFFDADNVKAIFSYPQPFHVFGLVLGYVNAIMHDLELIFDEGEHSPFTHQAWLNIDSDTRKGLMTLGTPTHFKDLIYFIEKRNSEVVPSYTSVCGGSLVPRGLWLDLQNKLKIQSPTNGYGSTEATLGVSHTRPGEIPKVDGELGYILPGVDAQLNDEGIHIHGASVCLSMIEQGSITFPDRITIPDIIKQQGDGRLVYQGRKTYFLNRGGEKYPLEEMETYLKTVLKMEVVCLVLDDARLGEELGIMVVSEKDLTEESINQIQHSLKIKFGKKFSADKIVAIKDLPLNANFKIDRKACLNFFDRHGKKTQVSLLTDYLPHRDPMIWINSVLSIGELEGVCEVIIDNEAYYNKEDGTLRSTAFVEWVAQSYGYVQAKELFDKGIPPTHGKVFLIGIENFEVNTTERFYDKEEKLSVLVKKQREVGPISYVYGEIKTVNNSKVLASGILKLYAQ